MTGICCPILKSRLGKCSFRKGGMGEAGCTDLLKEFRLSNNFPFCLQDMTFLVLKKKFESI